MKRLRGTFRAHSVTVPSDISEELVGQNLEGYPEETQRYVLEVDGERPDDTHFDRMLISMLHRGDSPETVEDTLFVYNNLPELLWEITEESDWDEDGFTVDQELIRKINGARRFLDPNGSSLRHCPVRMQDQALALVSLCIKMESDSHTSGALASNGAAIWIEDESTRNFIIQNPEREDEAWDLMTEHGRASWDVLESIMESPSAPLREGTL